MILDALPSHLSALVLDALFATSLWPLVVPVKTTKWLAPLDTHVFSPLKSTIEERVDKSRAESPSGDVNMPGFIGCIRGAIEDVLMKRRWAQAFAHDGYSCHQQGACAELCVAAGSAAPSMPPLISNRAPSLSQIEGCLPQRSKDKAAIIWRRFLQSPCDSSSVAATTHIFERTRSRTTASRATATHR